MRARYGGPPLSSLYWLPIAERSRALAEHGIVVNWYVRPAGGLQLGIPHVKIGPTGPDR